MLIHLKKKFDKNFLFGSISLLLWLILQILFASKRSLWGDEFFRFRQSFMPLNDALFSLFSEQCPVMPFEVFANYFFRILFNGLLAPELWCRIQSIFFNILTFFIVFKISLFRKNYLLPFFLISSLSLLMLTIQMRPYASLVFSGAYICLLLLDKSSHYHKKFYVLTAIFTVHLYGVFYLMLLLLHLKRYKLSFVALIYIISTISLFNITPIQQFGEYKSVLRQLYELMGILSGPTFLAALCLLFLLLGMFQNLKITLFFLLTIFFPMIVLMTTGHFQNYRQTSCAFIPFYYLCASGFETISRSSKCRRYVLMIVVILFFYFNYRAFKSPESFADVPYHKYKDLKAKIYDAKKILSLNPCGRESLRFYLLENQLTEELVFEKFGIEFKRYCDKKLCIDTPHSPGPCTIHPDSTTIKIVNALISEKKMSYDYIVHDFTELSVGNYKVLSGWR